jgi:ferredoxin/flavodoxin---NADP+ reductase
MKKLSKVAIVGSGPSAFFAAEALLKADTNIEIEIFEKLELPFGLVRYGVAPDHAKIKSVTKTFEKTLEKTNVQLTCGCEIGKDISIAQLQADYSAIILAYGAQTDRRMNIPGEDLVGSITATEFVAWYNGHPEYKNYHFNTFAKKVAIVGQGNVAIDVARILAKKPELLKESDIADYALDKLEQTSVEKISLIGRRGPAQAAFTDKELRELTELSNCNVTINEHDLELNEMSKTELESNAIARRNLDILCKLPSSDDTNKKNIEFRFYESPIAIEGSGKVENLVLEKTVLSGLSGEQKATGTGQFLNLDCDLVIRSIGYRGLTLESLPFNESRGTYYHDKGRLLDENGIQIPQLYVAGWIKRGPSGVIGSNKADSTETVASILEDFKIR